jgi:hypothetical protein
MLDGATVPSLEDQVATWRLSLNEALRVRLRCGKTSPFETKGARLRPQEANEAAGLPPTECADSVSANAVASKMETYFHSCLQQSLI